MPSIKPNIYASVSGHEAIVSMVGLGFGVGLVPELVINNSPLKDKIQILNVEPALQPFAIGLCAVEPAPDAAGNDARRAERHVLAVAVHALLTSRNPQRTPHENECETIRCDVRLRLSYTIEIDLAEWPDRLPDSGL